MDKIVEKEKKIFNFLFTKKEGELQETFSDGSKVLELK